MQKACLLAQRKNETGMQGMDRLADEVAYAIIK